MRFLVVLALLVLPLTAKAQFDAATGAVTVGQLIGGLKAAGNELIANAGTEARGTAESIQDNLIALERDLGETLKTQLMTPLKELSGDAQRLAQKGLAALSMAQAALNSMSACRAADVAAILKSLDTTLSANVRSWGVDQRYIASAFIEGPSRRLGLRAGAPPQLYHLNGVFDGYDPTCADPKVALRKVTPEAVGSPLSVVTASDREMTLQMPTLEAEGDYKVEVSYRIRKSFLFIHWCSSDRAHVATAFHVAPQLRFAASYSLWPTCDVPAVTEKSAHAFCQNDCGQPCHADAQVCVDQGTVMVGPIGRNDGTGAGCTKNVSQEGSACGKATVDCPPRGCKGPFKAAQLSGNIDVIVHQQAVVPGRPPNAIAGPFGECRYGGSVRAQPVTPNLIPVSGGQQAADCSWAVTGRIVFPDGSASDFPAVSGRHAQTTNTIEGDVLHWQPDDGSVTLSVHPYACDVAL